MKKLLCILLYLMFPYLNADKIPEYSYEVGWLPSKLKNDKANAKIFYIYYKADSKQPRPTIFCFNGGPGAAAAWLHIAAFGPRRLDLPSGTTPTIPTNIIDNPFSLLSSADLVFVDPVSTGYSRAENPNEAKFFFNYDNDAESLANFVYHFLQKQGIMNKRILLLGCSYATIRIVGIAEKLAEHYNIPIASLIMISTYLNYQSLLDPNASNDFPYPLYIPTYAAAAWYYNLGEARKSELIPWLKESSEWASSEYLQALMHGDTLTPKRKQEIIDKLNYYTGINKQAIQEENLRLSPGFVIKELLRDKQRTIGRFDLRFQGIDGDANRSEWFDYDPSYSLFGAVAAGLQSYLKNELKFDNKENLPYYMLGKAGKWQFNEEDANFFSVNKSLRKLFLNNNNIKLFVASGIYDLATPFFGTQYDLRHLGLTKEQYQERITHRLYNGGHMLYTDKEVLGQLTEDLRHFLQPLRY